MNHLKQTRKHCGFSAVMASVLTAVSTQPAGFDLPDQDAFAVGRGMAVVATANNPSAVYFNPAGLTQLKGNNLSGGIYGIDLEPGFRRNSDGREFENEDKLHAVPQFYYALGLEKAPVTFGLGLFSPFGLGTEWAAETGFRTVGTKAQMSTICANPVVAVEVFPKLSLGAGVTVTYAKADLQQGLVWPEQSFDKFRFKGDGWNVGYNLGAMWKPHEKISLGASFRSSTRINMNGSTEYYNTTSFPPGATPPLVPAFPEQHVDAEASFPFPLKAIVGISYRPTPKWNFEFNADYTDWDTFDTLTIKQEHGFPGLLTQDIPVIFGWESSWCTEFGATHYFNNNWLVSAGYIYSQTSVPDAHFSPLVTDLDRHFFSAGIGYRGKRFDFDLGYQFGCAPTRTVTGSAPTAIGQTADGRYDFLSHAVAVATTLHF